MKRVIGNNHASTGGKLEVDNWKVKSERRREMKKYKWKQDAEERWKANNRVEFKLLQLGNPKEIFRNVQTWAFNRIGEGMDKHLGKVIAICWFIEQTYRRLSKKKRRAE